MNMPNIARDKKQSIAVIGAGPAGITTALELQRCGYENITVYGKLEESQAKTVKLDDLLIDVGTCYLHPGYRYTTYPLAKMVDMKIRYLETADVITDKETVGLNSFVEKLKLFFSILKFMNLSLTASFLHNTPFAKKYAVSMEEYLKSHKIDSLLHSFVMSAGGVGQGYGFFDEVSADHLFQWLRPLIFLNIVKTKFRRGVAMIEGGWGTLFTKLLAYFHYIPEKITEVLPIYSSQTHTQQVRVLTESGEERYFDTVFVACPLDHLRSPATPLINPYTITYTPLFAALWKSDLPPFFRHRAYYTSLIEKKVKNQLVTLRLCGKTSAGEYVYVGMGYTTPEEDEQALRKQIEEALANKIGLPAKSIEYFKIYTYNRRFTKQAILEKIPLQVEQMQGVGRIWYSEGLLSHWDVNSIHYFSRRIVRRFAYLEEEPSLGHLIRYKMQSWMDVLKQL